MSNDRGVDSRADGHGSLRHEVHKQHGFESLHQEAYLSIARTRSTLEGAFHALFKRHRLTEPSFNLLRIVRGHEDRGEPIRSSAIREQMVVRVPDVTRLVDRLEQRGLVSRHRCPADKRVVFVRITPEGRELLQTLHAEVGRLHIEVLDHLTADELIELNRLLHLVRHPELRRPIDGPGDHSGDGGETTP